MAVNLYKNQSINVRKTWLLMSGFFLFIIFIGLFISYYYNDPSILFVAVFISIFMNIFSYWQSDKLVLKIAGAKRVTRKEYFDLYNLVENLSITAGLPMPKVYVIQDNVPNAFATGRNKDHSALAFSTGILEILDKAELEGVVAHELAHVGNRDILLQTIVVTLVGLVTLLADWFWRINFYGGGRDNDNKGGGQAQVIFMVVGIVLMILSPIIATVIQLTISRKREYLADSTGALLTRYPEGLASALEKIGSHSGKMKKANHATAHLFISDPFGVNSKLDNNKKNKNKKSFLARMFMTHPPIEDRVAVLRGMKI
jgi:heat shock protein HtpX